MSAGALNITIEQGATWELLLTWTIDDAPVSLAGYSARMQARPNHKATALLLDLTEGAGITLGGEAGTITLALSDEETAALPAGNYVYDLELVSPDEDVTRLVEGSLKISPEVTR